MYDSLNVLFKVSKHFSLNVFFRCVKKFIIQTFEKEDCLNLCFTLGNLNSLLTYLTTQTYLCESSLMQFTF